MMRWIRAGSVMGLVAALMTVTGTVTPARAASQYEAVVVAAPELPTVVEYGVAGSAVAVDVDFGTEFEAILRLCFTAEFEGDLLDQGESVDVFWEGGGVGSGNSSPSPTAIRTICISPIHNEGMAFFLDGVASIVVDTTPDFPDFTESSFNLIAFRVWAVAVADGADCTIVGTSGDDILHGTNGDDVICGLAGADVIYGHGGDDAILGGHGKDRLLAGAGNDLLFGGPKADTMFGGDGRDVLTGGDGWDKLYAGDGNDYVFGEGDPDRAYGQGGRDWIELGPGDRQTAYGGGDDDFVSGGPDRDRLYGGAGNDSLAGRWGDDKLFGGPDDDWLYGGPGDDWLCGQAGNDVVNGGGDAGDRFCVWDAGDG